MIRIFVGVCSIILAGRFLQILITTADGPVARVFAGISCGVLLIFGVSELFEKRFKSLHIEPGSRKDYIIFASIALIFYLLFGVAAYIYAPHSLLFKIILYCVSGIGVLWSLGFVRHILKRSKRDAKRGTSSGLGGNDI